MSEVVHPGSGLSVGAATGPSPSDRQEPVLPSSLELGLWAATLAEQGFAPFLLPDELERFQAHDVAISRLHIAKLISHAAHVSAREKLSKQIQKALRRPLPASATARSAAQTEAKPSGTNQ